MHNLETLDIVNRVVESKWLILPSVKSLTVGVRTDVIFPHALPLPPSSASIISLDDWLNFGVLMRGFHQSRISKVFFEKLGALKELRVRLGSCECSFPRDWDLREKGFDVLMEAVEEVKGTLELLEIGFVDEEDAAKMEGITKMTVPTVATFFWPQKVEIHAAMV